MIKGNIASQAEQSLQLLNQWLTEGYTLIGAQLKRKTVIPNIVLREAIVNALIHRRYRIPGAIKIALYDDHLEIFSLDSFPRTHGLK